MGYKTTKTMEYTEVELQEKAKNIASGEVLANVDALVRACLTKGLLSYEDIENYDFDEEVMAWHIITDWLYEKLKKVKATVIASEYGYFWGRTETGQNLMYDYHLQQVAENLP